MRLSPLERLVSKASFRARREIRQGIESLMKHPEQEIEVLTIRDSIEAHLWSECIEQHKDQIREVESNVDQSKTYIFTNGSTLTIFHACLMSKPNKRYYVKKKGWRKRAFQLAS